MLLATFMLVTLSSTMECVLADRQSNTPNHNSSIRKGSSRSRLSNLAHPVRRTYSLDNASIREEIHKLETRENHYWTTGVRADPSFQVNYVNHPYDASRERKERVLQQGDDDAASIESFMEPLRIHVDASALDAQRNSNNGAQIDFIKTKIMPRMTQFWSEALQVVPVSGKLRIQGNDLIAGFCGDSEFAEVPSEHMSQGVADTDLILYISGTPSTRFCGATTLAVAVACNWDQFDRPTAGAINFCINQVQVDASGTAHQSVIDDNVDVAIHEAGHVLGMSSNSYRFFWDPETGNPRTPRPIRAESVNCVDGTTKMAFIPAENTLKFVTRDNGKRAAVIVTEKVKTVARNQFNCDQIEGAQLEVSIYVRTDVQIII